MIDASALVELLLGGAAAPALTKRLRAADMSLHAPHLIDIETIQAIRRQVLRGDVAETRGEAALAELGLGRIARYPHAPLAARIWELRHNVTAYDAAYVALAESLEAPLLTCDRRLAASAGHRARIEAV